MKRTLNEDTMKTKHYHILLLSLIIQLTAVFPAISEIRAKIVDLDGDISISRNGEFLEYDEIDYGTEILAYDIIQTGPDGYAEIAIETPVSPDVIVHIMEDTTLFMEHVIKKQSPQTSINLHRGAVQTRAAALIQGGQLNIKTDSSVMGVRGTVFSVVIAADSSLLVTCRDGKVQCSTDGKDSYIQPGSIYEADSKGDIETKSLEPEKIDSYISDWKQIRLDALLINGAVSLNHYANLYLQSAPGFLETFADLSSKQDIFQKWERIIEKNESISMGEATRDKISLSNGIIRLRSRLPMMENIYYTLYDLTAIMDQSDQVRMKLSETTIRTLQIYDKRRNEFKEKLALARYYFRIFLEIDKQASGQSLMPSSDLMENFLLDEPLYIVPPEPSLPRNSSF
ncbi:MAG: hypothetical protein B6241_00245 [Spirochaetaceae bacterium 4572_59]|nr:MAG: hypothetical protein B6241_00245 [Spirochaetaceae bacterium 4572_59]